MSASNVITFQEKASGATYAEALAFIERTRRQLERFEVALPHTAEHPIAPEDAAEVRRLLDKLEASLRLDLDSI